MKKQKLTTKKLSLNKFKIAQLSNYGKSKIYGGSGVIDDEDDNRTTKTSSNCNDESTAICIKTIK